ncbi:MAG: RNA polymerase sigma factor [Flavobacteriales bacterium]
MWIAHELAELMPTVKSMESNAKPLDPNASLVERCLNNDAVAQRGLFDSLLPYLKSAVRRYIWSEEDVQDVLQEAFLRIFRKLHQFDASKGQVQTWATKIAINAAISFGTKASKRSEQILSLTPETQEPAVFNQFNAEALLQRLKALPRDQYEVLILHAVDGYSHDEIAALLNISSMTSRKRLSRAKQWIVSRFDVDGSELILKKNTDHESD